MTVLVIDALEVGQVQQQDGGARPSPRFAELGHEDFAEVATVEEAGHRILTREAFGISSGSLELNVRLLDLLQRGSQLDRPLSSERQSRVTSSGRVAKHEVDG